MSFDLDNVPGLTPEGADHFRKNKLNVYEAVPLIAWAGAAGCGVTDLSRNEIRHVLTVTYNRKVDQRDNPNMMLDGLEVAYGAMQTIMRHETFQAAMKDPAFREHVQRRLFGPRYVGISTLCDDIANEFGLSKEGGEEA